MNTTEYQVTGMTCGHCEGAIRTELRIVGLEVADVSSSTGRLVVTSDEAIDDTVVLRAVDEAGYEAVRV